MVRPVRVRRAHPQQPGVVGLPFTGLEVDRSRQDVERREVALQGSVRQHHDALAAPERGRLDAPALGAQEIEDADGRKHDGWQHGRHTERDQ